MSAWREEDELERTERLGGRMWGERGTQTTTIQTSKEDGREKEKGEPMHEVIDQESLHVRSHREVQEGGIDGDEVDNHPFGKDEEKERGRKREDEEGGEIDREIDK